MIANDSRQLLCVMIGVNVVLSVTHITFLSATKYSKPFLQNMLLNFKQNLVCLLFHRVSLTLSLSHSHIKSQNLSLSLFLSFFLFLSLSLSLSLFLRRHSLQLIHLSPLHLTSNAALHCWRWLPVHFTLLTHKTSPKDFSKWNEGKVESSNPLEDFRTESFCKLRGFEPLTSK